MPRLTVLFLILAALLPARPMAQAPPSKEKDTPVPKASLPPAGMCRIWIDNVPAARQPAPTDCATAIRNKPPNARVLFPAPQGGRQSVPKVAAPVRPDSSKRKPPG